MIGQASAWTPLATLTVLIVAFSLKHFLADFVLQTGWIALGKDCRTDWVRPLIAHVTIHAGLALAIILVVAPRLWWLALVDFVVHFGVDRGKTIAGRWGEWGANDARYWWLFGFDQLLHQLTNIGLAFGLTVL
ncbi:DUF3307 domain-containing protein [Micromonospora sp. STR1s_5]|nr:DUF3307 domain-containing protein [Micromonospora sp. STR1s_5]